MQVKEILDKLVKDQPDALAVLVRHGEYAYQNLQAPYDMIAAEDVLETVSDVYHMTDSLEDEGYTIGDMILSFDNHSLVSRKIDGGAIVVLANAMARPQLIKLQVGLGLYVRSLEKALANEPAEEEATVEAAPEPANPEPEEKLSLPAQGSGLTQGFGRMLGRAFGGDTVASKNNTGPTDEEIAAAIKAGKKVRHYRGQAYIE